MEPELERFMEYLNENGALAKDSDEDEWKKIIAEYMAEFEKLTLRAKLFFH